MRDLINRSCGRCEVFHVSGECRLSPPIWTGNGFAFPKVSTTDFCAGFRESVSVRKAEVFADVTKVLSDSIDDIRSGKSVVISASDWAFLSEEVSEYLSSLGLNYSVSFRGTEAVITATKASTEEGFDASQRG